MTDQREPVKVGIDLRPIPMEMSDGNIYHMNPDPPKEFYASVSRNKEERVAASNSEDPEVDEWEFIDALREILATQITTDEDKKTFAEANYGLAALNDLARAYSATVLGRPT